MQSHIVLKPRANTYLTVSTAAVALATPPTDCVGAILRVESADVRMRWDGTNPAAGVGNGTLWAKDSVWEVTGRDVLTAMRFIRDTGVDGVISCDYLAGE